jgi:hypothetical protein
MITKCLKIFIVINFISIAFLSCKNKATLHTHYQTELPSKLDLMFYRWKGYSGYTMGEKLQLNTDSSFVFTTCGYIAKGRWKENERNISLRTFQIEKRIDSTSTSNVDFDTIPFFNEEVVFKRRGQKLVNKSFGRLRKLEWLK